MGILLGRKEIAGRRVGLPASRERCNGVALRKKKDATKLIRRLSRERTRWVCTFHLFLSCSALHNTCIVDWLDDLEKGELRHRIWNS
jgi:hypothetical protein